MQASTLAVLFCDQVGSTDLLTRVGDEAAEEVRRDLFAVLHRAAAMARGEVVKSTGDGVMAVFPGDPTDALRCAILMQRGVAPLAARDPSVGLALRVGVSFGPAVPDGGDWYGAAINLAARLCAAATAGQILVSDALCDRVDGTGGLELSSVGSLTLRGFPAPVSASALGWTAEAQTRRVPLPVPLGTDGALPFVGREWEREQLARALAGAVAGERRVVLVGGEPGVGVTRLFSEAATAAHAQGAIVLYGRCGRTSELGPLGEALRWYALARPPEQLRGELGSFAGTVADVVPSVGSRLGIALPGLKTGAGGVVEAATVMLVPRACGHRSSWCSTTSMPATATSWPRWASFSRRSCRRMR